MPLLSELSREKYWFRREPSLSAAKDYNRVRLQYLEQCLNLIPAEVDINAGLDFRISSQFHEPAESKTRRNSRTHQRKRVWNDLRYNKIDIRSQSGRQVRGRF